MKIVSRKGHTQVNYNKYKDTSKKGRMKEEKIKQTERVPHRLWDHFLCDTLQSNGTAHT
jgi:hypothetical protein